jgi:DNA polymerase-3 subunit delta
VLLGEKLGAREKLLSAVKKVGEVRSFEQPTGKALVRWTVGYGKMQGLELPEAVAEELVVRCSDDKVRVSREVEKLSLYVSGAATLNDVEVLVSPDLQANIFAFVDSLAAGDQDDAMSLLEALIATGEPPLRITYMIRRQFRLLARAHALNKSGASRSEVTSTLKVPPFVARKLEEQSRKMNQVDFEGALAVVLDLERGLKGRSDLGDELQVELAVLKLADPMG